MAHKEPKFSVDRRQVLLALVFVLALYILVPQLSSFHNSWHLLRHPILSWTLLAVCLTLATYVFAALTYYLLAFVRLRYLQALLVQLAAMFVNRLLPAGVGGLGANYIYLRHKKHTKTQATSVVAVNNLLGLAGHTLLVLIVLVLASSYNRRLAFHAEHNATLAIHLIIGLAIVMLLIVIIISRNVLKRSLAAVIKQILVYRQRPWRAGGALLSSMALTLCNMLCLYSCMIALGVHLPFIVVVLIFSFGLGTGTATPTPGGLGGFEAGLVAGFVTYHVASASALAIALLFRLISYWLPLVFGLMAFVVAQRQHLFATPHGRQ